MQLQFTTVAPSVVARFWPKVRLTNTCWIWTAAISEGGYGVIQVAGKLVKAHRLSWHLHFGPFRDGLWVLHHCDNPRCVNPSHLFLGTPKDNMQDMMSKGRGKNPNAKLTEAQVHEIREIRKTDGRNQSVLAKQYGISQSAISRIIIGKTWVAGHQESLG